MFAGSNICFVFFREMSTNVVHSLAPAAAAVGEVHAPEEAAPPAQPQGVGVEHGALAHINEQMARLQDAADMLNVQALANKKENRKGKVANAVSPLKSAAGKRTVSFLAVVPEIS